MARESYSRLCEADKEAVRNELAKEFPGYSNGVMHDTLKELNPLVDHHAGYYDTRIDSDVLRKTLWKNKPKGGL